MDIFIAMYDNQASVVKQVSNRKKVNDKLV